MPRARQVDPNTVAFLRAAGCVYAEDEARILTHAAHSDDELRGYLERRAAGEPVEYIVGWAEYSGLRISVCGGVFVPRKRSEFLGRCAAEAVHDAAERTRGTRRVKVLDMCCGSGAIGLAVALESGNVELLAADNSSAAVACARQNLAPVDGRVYEGDLFDAIPRTEMHGLDLIIANAPYVPTSEIQWLPAEARQYEPIATLDGGRDGAAVQRRLLDAAAEWLRPSGVVLIETGRDIADATAQAARNAGFTTEIRRCAEFDATVVVATHVT